MTLVLSNSVRLFNYLKIRDFRHLFLAPPTATLILIACDPLAAWIRANQDDFHVVIVLGDDEFDVICQRPIVVPFMNWQRVFSVPQAFSKSPSSARRCLLLVKYFFARSHERFRFSRRV